VNKCWEVFSSISLPSIPKIENWNVECNTILCGKKDTFTPAQDKLTGADGRVWEEK
jgi:hypothetical protein